jgi:hypothetical protein
MGVLEASSLDYLLLAIAVRAVLDATAESGYNPA